MLLVKSFVKGSYKELHPEWVSTQVRTSERSAWNGGLESAGKRVVDAEHLSVVVALVFVRYKLPPSVTADTPVLEWCRDGARKDF